MKFGIFDHIDRRDESLGQFYEDRLELFAAEVMPALAKS